MKKWHKVPIGHINDSRGCLSVLEQNENFNFDVKRVYFVSDVPDSLARGSHAHEELSQIIFSTSGSFKLLLDDGNLKEEFLLEKGGDGLFVEGLVWRTIDEFTENAVMMVLCDRIYKYDVVIRDYGDFLEKVQR